MKTIIRKILCVIIALFLLLPAAMAATAPGQFPEWGELENYSLDIEETGLFETGDAIMNGIANILFALVKSIGWLIVTIFQKAMGMNLAGQFEGQINSIQSALKLSIFDQFFILAFCAAAFMLVKQMAKRNMSGLAVEFAKILAILLLSSFVVTHSAETLKGATDITLGIAQTALIDINEPGGAGGIEDPTGGASNVSDYAKNTGNFLWRTLVYNQWKSLEFFDVDSTDAEIQAILAYKPGSEERQAAVNDYIASHPGAFSKSLGIERIGYLLVYLIPFLIKCVIFVFVSIILLGFQVMAIFYVLLAPIILLLALIPGFGIDMISSWLKKILETQLMIVIISFLLGLVVKLDTFLAPPAGSNMGMAVAMMLLQAAIAAFLVWKYDFVLKSVLKGVGKGVVKGAQGISRGVSKVQSAVRNPRAALDSVDAGSAANALGAGVNRISAIRNQTKWEGQSEARQEEAYERERKKNYAQAAVTARAVKAELDRGGYGRPVSTGSSHSPVTVTASSSETGHTEKLNRIEQKLDQLGGSQSPRPVSTEQTERPGGMSGTTAQDNPTAHRRPVYRPAASGNVVEFPRPVSTAQRQQEVQSSMAYSASVTERPVYRPAAVGETPPQQRPVSAGQRPPEGQSSAYYSAPAAERPACRPVPAGEAPIQQRSVSVEQRSPEGQSGVSYSVPAVERAAYRPVPAGEAPIQQRSVSTGQRLPEKQSGTSYSPPATERAAYRPDPAGEAPAYRRPISTGNVTEKSPAAGQAEEKTQNPV